MRGFRKLEVNGTTYWWCYPGRWNVVIRTETQKRIVCITELEEGIEPRQVPKHWECSPTCSSCLRDNPFSITPSIIANWIKAHNEEFRKTN